MVNSHVERHGVALTSHTRVAGSRAMVSLSAETCVKPHSAKLLHANVQGAACFQGFLQACNK
jgi:hypothetical protein